MWYMISLPFFVLYKLWEFWKPQRDVIDDFIIPQNNCIWHDVLYWLELKFKLSSNFTTTQYGRQKGPNAIVKTESET